MRVLYMALILGLAVASTAAAGPIANLALQSQPGDFIGQGDIFDIAYTPANSDFFSPQVRRTVGSSPAELLFVLGTVTGDASNTFALLFFGTDQLGIPMQTGVYTDAQRADFATPGHPGLDISFQNRGCNTVSGSFTVTDAVFTGDTINSFSASFVQHCEGAEPALTGSFTYFSAAPAAVPEPGTSALLAFPLLAIFFVSYLIRRPSRASDWSRMNKGPLRHCEFLLAL